MRKRRSNFDLLFKINVRLAFNKKSIFTLLTSFIILLIYLIFISYNSYDKEAYLLAFNDVHMMYLKEGLFVINIINFLLILVFSTTLFVNSDSFDSMYVSYISRNIVSKSRIWAMIYLELVICIISFISLILPPLIIYPYFKIELSHMYIFGYILILGLLQIAITMLLISFVNNNFIPMLGFLISFFMQIISMGFSDKIEYLEYFIPINYNKYELPIIGVMIFFSSILIYKMKYNVKNIN